jgi:transcriptional regulator with XRE-family HTH domain
MMQEANTQPSFESRLSRRMITAMQCRMARAALRWGVRELASRASVSTATIANFEREVTAPTRATRMAIQRAFEDAGIEFTNGRVPGVRFKGKP